MQNSDAVDKIIDQWKKEGITEDLEPMETIGRIARLYAIISKKLEENFNGFGLTRPEFDVLAALRRSGEPYTLSPTELFDTLMVTSGTMTNRLSHLEKKGLIIRLRDETDRRSMPVKLSSGGFKLVEKCLKAHIETEAKLTSGLSKEQLKKLNHMLKEFEEAL